MRGTGSKAPILIVMAYPKTMMGLPLELWMIVLVAGLLSGFGTGFVTGGQITLVVLVGTLVAACVFGLLFLQTLRNPFFLVHMMEYGQAAPFLNTARFSGEPKGKRYVPF